MRSEEFVARRQYVETEFGSIAYVEKGSGPATLFLHGFPLNGFHWRAQLDELCDIRRCIAIDLMGLGYTEVADSEDLGFTNQAKMVIEVIARLQLDNFDLVGNDSGGAIAQIVATMVPEKVRSLTLTNCDVHDNWPPAAFSQSVGLANAGRLGSSVAELKNYPGLAQSDFGLGVGFQDREQISQATVAAYVEPLLDKPDKQTQLDRFVVAMECHHTVDIHAALSGLQVPTFVLWGDDDIFFPLRWGQWLADTIPGTRQFTTVEGGRLFFCEEMPDVVNAHLRAFWDSCDGLDEGSERLELRSAN